ncbi:hypothetical protein L1987_58887 [Smallanthus sonchifolius]|uniref:Uncharacterized protein n=1 Tax=Smallanthus sonchifolius TaxID=185202 RepID=A0ACB9D3P9_9ASTR|nr:hypothetical protein L1987_58887 [Smallanthus sonchifolius]
MDFDDYLLDQAKKNPDVFSLTFLSLYGFRSTPVSGGRLRPLTEALRLKLSNLICSGFVSRFCYEGHTYHQATTTEEGDDDGGVHGDATATFRKCCGGDGGGYHVGWRPLWV